MSDAKAIDISAVKFSSSVFPTLEDRALWESLTPAERLAIVERDEEAGFRSGVARHSSRHETLAEVRAETKE
jgi:predicted Fe-S protein YdhL (DUF1289 family)